MTLGTEAISQISALVIALAKERPDLCSPKSEIDMMDLLSVDISKDLKLPKKPNLENVQLDDCTLL